jgi:NADPH:quinone reductase-like Zn-dependent oxidoreductase
MKAFIYERYGPPEVLQLKEIPAPIPKENELLVRVMSAGVNRTDCANLHARPYIMRRSMGLFKPRKKILGTEFSGSVEAVGTKVIDYKIGDRVFGFADSGVRSYAEFLTVTAGSNISVMPEEMTFKQAACCIEGAHYAYNFINKVNVRPEQKVFINGGTGAIGSALIQLIAYLKADVTATCTSETTRLIKSLGATKVLDYTRGDILNDDDTYDYVFDAVGKSSFEKCKRLLKPGGVYISSELGKNSINVWLSLLTGVFGSVPGNQRKKVKFPYPANIKRSIDLIKSLFEGGHYSAVIDRAYPFEQLREAFQYVESGKKIGNVVLIVKDTVAIPL